MKYSHIKTLLYESRMSPEQFGSRAGISGMTLRRWSHKPADDKIPEIYEQAIHKVIFDLLAEGKIPKDSELVQEALSSCDQTFFTAALKNLGINQEDLKNVQPNTESVLKTMSKIGTRQKQQETVNEGKKRILAFGKLGAEWKYRIQALFRVIQSKDLSILDKAIAYGALFYLLTPIDLVPDHIPMFGLTDDFLILGVATLFYVSHFPKVFPKGKKLS